jgi:hypothetical protein
MKEKERHMGKQNGKSCKKKKHRMVSKLKIKPN